MAVMMASMVGARRLVSTSAVLGKINPYASTWPDITTEKKKSGEFLLYSMYSM